MNAESGSKEAEDADMYRYSRITANITPALCVVVETCCDVETRQPFNRIDSESLEVHSDKKGKYYGEKQEHNTMMFRSY